MVECFWVCGRALCSRVLVDVSTRCPKMATCSLCVPSPPSRCGSLTLCYSNKTSACLGSGAKLSPSFLICGAVHTRPLTMLCTGALLGSLTLSPKVAPVGNHFDSETRSLLYELPEWLISSCRDLIRLAQVFNSLECVIAKGPGFLRR